jgi:hypothetical protein
MYSKIEFIQKVRTKISKLKSSPLDVLKLPNLIYTIYREWLHQRRFIEANAKKAKGTHSSRRINSISKEMNSNQLKYLEIGIAHGYTFEAIEIKNKTAVDPFPKCRIRKNENNNSRILAITSNKFFESRSLEELFNIIFIDGLHTFEQTYIDIINSLNVLSPSGIIILDDVVPGDKYSALPSIELCRKLRIENGEQLETWSGDVFKSLCMLKTMHPYLEIVTIISPNHPQTLIWNPKNYVNKIDLNFDKLRMNEFNELDYESQFSDLSRLNNIFNFQMEWRAIQLFSEFLKNLDKTR